MNRAVLVGRLTRDLELKKTQSGQSVCNFNIAVNRTYKNANGEKETDFINCVAWGRTADNMATYVGKGSLIGVDGPIQTRSYDNANGQKVYVTEVFADSVQFLESKGSQQAKQQQQINQQPGSDFFDVTQDQPSSDILSGLDISDDELPF